MPRPDARPPAQLLAWVHRDYPRRIGAQVDAWWDVQALLSYGPLWRQSLPIQIDGRAPLDVAGMTGRMEEVLERALRRL